MGAPHGEGTEVGHWVRLRWIRPIRKEAIWQVAKV